MNRRSFVAAAAVGAIGASAGCLSDILDDVTTFEASPIRVSEAAADEAGYEYQGTTERVEEREFAGESVEATNYISEYTRTIDLPLDLDEPDAGVFALVSTPDVSVAGETFNPVGDMSEAELAEYVQGQYDELDLERNVGGRAIDSDDIEGLNTTVSLSTYEGTATLQGEVDVDIRLDVAQPDHDDDHLVIMAVYPDVDDLPIEDDETDRVDTLVAGIEHGEDVEVEIVDEDEADDGNSDDEDE
ncbi:DUF6517 family protein [Natronolimnohabitans innermongolicus]|nr:DUF6517 family protein [Natronolimnohabitans innermongolicus]